VRVCVRASMRVCVRCVCVCVCVCECVCLCVCVCVFVYVGYPHGAVCVSETLIRRIHTQGRVGTPHMCVSETHTYVSTPHMCVSETLTRRYTAYKCAPACVCVYVR